MPRRVSKRLSAMGLDKVATRKIERDWRNVVDVPMRLDHAKVLKCMRKGTWLSLSDGSEELINNAYWGISTAFRAGLDPIPPVGAWMDVMVHGVCPWKVNRDGKLRVDIHHWQKDPGYCNYESGYRGRYDAEKGLFAVPPWDINKEKK